MATKGITIDQVRQAFNDLQTRGEAPTLIAIRQELGNSGSMSTIHRHLREIRQEHGTTSQSVPEDTPEDLKKLMTDVMSTLWRKASEIASADVEAIRKSALEQVEALNRELQEAHEGMKMLDGELYHCQEDLANAIEQVNALRTENVRYETRLAELQSQHEENIKRFDRYAEQLERTLQALGPAVKQPKTGKAKP